MTCPRAGGRTRAVLRAAIFEYIEGFYNPIRLHSTLGHALFDRSSKPSTLPAISTAPGAHPDAEKPLTASG